MDTHLIRWRDEMIERARVLLERDGRLQPVCILRREPRGPLRGEQRILALSFADVAEKDLAAEVLRFRARRMRADVALLILECWTTHPEDPEGYLAAGIAPADDPTHEECVLLHMETRDECCAIMMQIHRDGGRVWMGAPADFQADVAVGRFTGIVYSGPGGAKR